jgi:hypothetical protein
LVNHLSIWIALSAIFCLFVACSDVGSDPKALATAESEQLANSSVGCESPYKLYDFADRGFDESLVAELVTELVRLSVDARARGDEGVCAPSEDEGILLAKYAHLSQGAPPQADLSS